MTPQDAVFLAIAAALFLERPKTGYVLCLAPLVAWGARYLPLGDFHTLVVALVVCLPAPGYAPVALLLVLPEYVQFTDALVAAVVWLTGISLMDSLEIRWRDEVIPAILHGAPIRLLSVGILYYLFLPVFYL